MSRTALALVGVLVLLATACDATRTDHRTCYESERNCLPGTRCNLATFQCERDDDGGSDGRADGVPDLSTSDVPMANGPDAGSHDASPVSDVYQDAPLPVLDSGSEGVGVPLDSASVDVDVDGGAAIDARPLDAAGTCGGDDDCVSARARFCVQGLCVSCRTSTECSGGTPVCSAGHACVSCAGVDAGCPAGVPACEVDSGRCVECVGDGECAGKAGRSFCVNRQCAPCSAAAAAACAARDPSKPVCLAGGACGECAGSADCTVARKPICDTGTGTCSACTADSQCQAKGNGAGVCLADGHCATTAETIYVGRTATGSCSDTAMNAGSALSPFCSADKAIAAGKPVLVVLGPLTDSFVLGALASPLLIVGRNGVLTARNDSDGISMTSGELTLRNLTITASASSNQGIGIDVQVPTGRSATLHVDGCTISKHADGGIFLSGAAFDIRDSAISNNRAGQTANGIVWAGIRVDKLPANGSTSLELVTLSDNASTGLSCVAAVQGQGVLATGNSLNITNSCGFSSCPAAGPACGAQP